MYIYVVLLGPSIRFCYFVSRLFQSQVEPTFRSSPHEAARHLAVTVVIWLPPATVTTDRGTGSGRDTQNYRFVREKLLGKLRAFQRIMNNELSIIFRYCGWNNLADVI